MKRARRALLAALALAAMAAPSASTGCAGAGFDSISTVDTVRVLAVQADKPYARPGDTVTFTMTLDDGYVNPSHPDAGPRPLEILWIGGCFDPDGDQYYGCYSQLASEFSSPGAVGDIGAGLTFSITLPEDIITRRPKPSGSTPYYGIAYVFFAVCAGTLKPVAPEGTGLSGSFPIGCFDAAGNRLGEDSFVPGFTQVYAFADGRTNANPQVLGLEIDGAYIGCRGAPEFGDAGPHVDGPDGGDCVRQTIPEVVRCDVSEEDRRAPPGCGRRNALTDCVSYDLTVLVPHDVAEVDPSGTGENGMPLREAVWVDYFADQGDIDSPVKLVSDGTLGIQSGYDSLWTPPPTPGPAKLWAVVHDGRGGVTPFERTVMVR
jgi:hypothetical protein